MLQKNIGVDNSRILILGLAFKENCPDFRNTRVIDIVNELKTHNLKIDIYDPWIEAKSANQEYNINMTRELKDNTYDAIIVAVNCRLQVYISVIQAMYVTISFIS